MFSKSSKLQITRFALNWVSTGLKARRCFIASVAVSSCLLLPVWGFAQEQSGLINKRIEQLKSPEPNVRRNAADALGAMGSAAKESVPALSGVLRRDKSLLVRRSAADALGQIGVAENALPALRDVINNGSDFYLRGSAVDALGNIIATAKDAMQDAVQGAVSTLVKVLKQDKDTSLQSKAASALGVIGPAARDAVPDLIDVLRNKKVESTVRDAAADALGWMGSTSKEAVDVLFEMLKDDVPPSVRGSAALALGRTGASAEAAVPALIEVLKRDQSPVVRLEAALGLGQEGAAAKAAVPALIDVLKKDDSPAVRTQAANSLGSLGALAKGAVPALIDVVSNREVVFTVRSSVANALGNMGPDAEDAVPALIQVSKEDDTSVRFSAVASLVAISRGLYHVRRTKMLSALREAYESLKDDPDHYLHNQVRELKLTIDDFDSLWWVGLVGKTWRWIQDNQGVTEIIAAYLFLFVFWLFVFSVRPLWFLPLSTFFGQYETKIKLLIVEFDLPLRHLLLVSLFHYRKRVLDSWVRQHLETAKENFAKKQTVRRRKTYVQTRVMINEQTFDSLSPAQLQRGFNKLKSTLLISGEGGAGKTSLACQMAAWSMTDEPEKRLCKNHAMLPVLIECNLEPQTDGKNAFTEAIRGQLRELIGMPNAIPEEILLQLLRKRRVLVIVDSLSELDDATRLTVRPAQPDFPVAALIVTSRADDDLRGVTKTIIKPLKLKSDRLSSFMDRYLEQRGSRESFTDEEYFESCRNLSQIIRNRDITAMIAKMYVELMIASKGEPSELDSPRNLPDLMLGYVNNINESEKANKKNIAVVLPAAKAAAWECLRKSFRPADATRNDVLSALKREADPEALVVYLEKRMQLIQTAGAGKDKVRFSLDPLAEYLSSLYLIEHHARRTPHWSGILDQMKAQPGAPDSIRGFLLALLDCCRYHGREYGVPESAIEGISRLLNPDTGLEAEQRARPRPIDRTT